MNVGKLCNGCDDCNQKAPMFKALSSEELRILNKDRYSVRFHEGEVILKQGTRADYLISVVEGFAKTCIEGHNERNLILEYIKPWRLVGGPAAHVGGKHRYSVIAVQETLVCFIDVKNFTQVLGQNGAFAEQVLIHCSGNYLSSLERMVGLSQKQMHGRIADALIYLSTEIYRNPVVGAEISRQDMADFTSMSKDSAIRILKEFERDEIIVLDGKRIEIISESRLNEISQRG